jgi:hypothetical protein
VVPFGNRVLSILGCLKNLDLACWIDLWIEDHPIMVMKDPGLEMLKFIYSIPPSVNLYTATAEHIRKLGRVSTNHLQAWFTPRWYSYFMLWYTCSFQTLHSFSPLKLMKPQILLQNQILHLILSIVTPLHHPGFLNGLVVILILRFLATFYLSKSTILHHRYITS